MSNVKDLLTTVAAIAILVFTAIQQYLATIPADGTINWFQVVVAVGVAVIGYFTGKNPDGTTKKNPEVV